MTPIGWLARYFLAAVVGATVTQKAIEIVKDDAGDLVKGVAFRDRVHRNSNDRDDT
jgi:hypothetical protein|tara:strand:- start:418 stop:585 length:168 start_codon:yes stop_codon:yes gene_type:complete